MDLLLFDHGAVVGIHFYTLKTNVNIVLYKILIFI
jgi:hypothetical protein